jgi:hypothetical protein
VMTPIQNEEVATGVKKTVYFGFSVLAWVGFWFRIPVMGFFCRRTRSSNLHVL